MNIKALADISNFNTMNNCANEKLLAQANEQLEEEVAKNVRLLEAIVSQTSFIDSLKSLNMESVENMSSMKELIGEKDKVRHKLFGCLFSQCTCALPGFWLSRISHLQKCHASCPTQRWTLPANVPEK